MTATKLLTFQFFLQGLPALVLLLMPNSAIRLAGLPTADNGFWPRLLGGVLLGIALAALATLAGWTTPGAGAGIGFAGAGLGLAGEVMINLSAAFVLLSILFLGPTQQTVRGAILCGALAAGMILLALIEVAYL